MIAGGLAIVAYGYLRFTADIDLIINLKTENVEKAIFTLSKLRYIPKIPVSATDFADESKRKQWIEENGMLVFSMFSEKYLDAPIDIFAKMDFDFDEEYKKAVWLDINDKLKVPFVPYNRLIELKETAGREQDKIDIINLREINE
jgi:hypothetical protein